MTGTISTARRSTMAVIVAILALLMATMTPTAQATVTALAIDSPTTPTNYGSPPADVDVTFTWSENHVFGDYRSIITIGDPASPVAQETFVYQPGDEIRSPISDGSTETYQFTHTVNVPAGTPDGAYDLTVKVEENWPPGSSTWGFSQTETLTGVVVIQGDPTTKDECKDGGWAEFGFRNQGQCIRFVETGQDSR